MQLEDEAGVIIEAAPEAGREPEARDIEAARRHEAGARLEGVERGVERRACASAASARRAAAASSGSPAIGEEALDQARASRRQAAACAERRLVEEALGDLAGRAAADRA